MSSLLSFVTVFFNLEEENVSMDLKSPERPESGGGSEVRVGGVGGGGALEGEEEVISGFIFFVFFFFGFSAGLAGVDFAMDFVDRVLRAFSAEF